VIGRLCVGCCPVIRGLGGGEIRYSSWRVIDGYATVLAGLGWRISTSHFCVGTIKGGVVDIPTSHRRVRVVILDVHEVCCKSDAIDCRWGGLSLSSSIGDHGRGHVVRYRCRVASMLVSLLVCYFASRSSLVVMMSSSCRRLVNRCSWDFLWFPVLGRGVKFCLVVDLGVLLLFFVW